MKICLRYCISICILAGLFCCKNPQPAPRLTISRGFYSWSNSYILSEGSDTFFKDMGVSKLYCKLFDVAWNEHTGNAEPSDDFSYFISNNLFVFDSIEYVPVVYITNDVFVHLNDSGVILLAEKISHKIFTVINSAAFFKLNEMHGERWYGYGDHGDDDPYMLSSTDFGEMRALDSLREVHQKCIPEFQFDCDWTAQTRDRYFLFLQTMRNKLNGKKISCTIRLYQYKYFHEQGVPPVDKGMLMCYNTGDIRKQPSSNSIFNRKEVIRYLSGSPYPLPLDYALPIFSWAAVYRAGKIYRLLSLQSFYFNDKHTYFRMDDEGEVTRYYVNHEVELGYGNDVVLLKKGDIIKVESPDLNQVKLLADYIKQINTNTNPSVVLFNFSEDNVKGNEEKIRAIFEAY